MKAPKLAISAITLLLAIAHSAAADPISLSMHQAESGNFYVHATLVGDIETDLLLDTGSGYVSVGRDTFRKINESGKPRFSRHIYGRMAIGKVEKVALYFVDELRLTKDCVLKDIEVAHFPKADRDILGLNALSRLQPFTMELAPAKLTSSNCAG